MVKATADHTLYAHWAVPTKAPTIDNITEDQTIVYGKDPHFSLGYGSTIAYKVSEKWYECDQNGNNARLLTDEAGEPVFEPVRPTVGVHYLLCGADGYAHSQWTDCQRKESGGKGDGGEGYAEDHHQAESRGDRSGGQPDTERQRTHRRRGEE